MKLTIEKVNQYLIADEFPAVIKNTKLLDGRLIQTVQRHREAYLAKGENFVEWLEPHDLVEAEITSIQEGYNYYSKSYREWKERRKVLLQAIQSE